MVSDDDFDVDPLATRVVVKRADEIAVECIRWLWEDHLARGKLHLLVGPPGVNKTTLWTAIVATLSTGGRWPDGSRAQLGASLVWSGEDGIADTLLPRLMAHGADLSRVHFVSAVVDNEGRRPFDPSLDMERLRLHASRIQGLALIVADPVVLTVRGDSHKDGEVRRGLQPLVELAERSGAAAVGVAHFAKNSAGRSPVDRVAGSLAFGAAARVVLAVGRIPDDQGGGRLMVRAKSNIGPDGGGFRFAVTPIEVAGGETVRVEWGEPMHGSAHDLLSTIERTNDPDERAADNDVDVFLREILIDAGGAMNRKEVLAVAKRAGYPERTVERSRARCRIVVKTSGFGSNRHSTWTLPPITDTRPRTRNDGGNGSNDNDESISAITAVENRFARATVMGDDADDAEAYRRATRGE
jgi:hypothetical protein